MKLLEGTLDATAPAALEASDTTLTPGQITASLKRWRIPGDIITRTCQAIDDEALRSSIRWAAGYCRDRNLSCGDFGELLQQPRTGAPYSADSVYQLFTGRRDVASVKNFCTSVDAFRRRVEETGSQAAGSFIETSLTRKIWGTCRTALTRRQITFIFGPSQIGKTTALAEYARRNNHGETILIRMPTRGSMGELLEEFAIRLGLGAQTKTRLLRRRIIESFDDRTLLVIDEAHQCLTSHYSDRALGSLEFIREIHDRRKCGVVICGTEVLRIGLQNHPVLRQLWLRGYRPLNLPGAPTDANILEFDRAFGLTDPPDKNIRVNWEDPDTEDQRSAVGNPAKLQATTIKTFGLGRWCRILEDARDAATDDGKRITWGHVIRAAAAFQPADETH
jgi:DNA transposition AAA+ family ATPase